MNNELISSLEYLFVVLSHIFKIDWIQPLVSQENIDHFVLPFSIGFHNIHA